MYLTIGGLKRLALYMGGQLKSAVSITGGTLSGVTVNNSAIGGTTPAAGAFTTLSASGNLTCSGNSIRSVAATVSAAGTDQATATALTADINDVTTVGSGSGVKLPTAVTGMKITVFSDGANNLLVYPATGGAIDGGTANSAATLTSTKRCDFVALSTTAWKSAQLGAVSA